MKREKRMLMQDQRWNWVDHLFLWGVVASCLLTAWSAANLIVTMWGLIRG